jgi:Carboxypeptidase regulatory-like domain/TonB dependent receptor
VVSNEKTGVSTTVNSNSEGQYHVANLLPGLYDVQATAKGFQPTSLKAVTVDLNKTATADVVLGVGNNETVEVSADSSAALDTTSQNLTQTFNNQELSSLPIATIGGAGQSGVLNVSLLAPGVASSGGLGIGVGPSIGGQRPRNNNFTIEGIDNNNKAITGPLVYIPNDAVGDFSLITNQFSPEFGHSSGGQFNTNVVSGTNTVHGRVYEYFQNRDLNAASGIAGGKIANPRYDNNRYGGEISGPVVKNKLFFFANYERNTVGQTHSYYLCTPTASGLTQLSNIAGNYGISANNLAQYKKYIPAATLTGQGGAGVDATNDNACGNQATGAQFLTVTDPSGVNPKANIPLGNYLVNGGSPINFWALTSSLDYTINNSDSLRLRYIYNNEAATDSVAALPTFYTSQPFKYHLFTLSEYHTFTPNLLNEFRIGFNRYENELTAGNFSYPGLDSFPNLYFYDQGGIDVGPDDNAPQFTIQNLYQATDNVSWTKGRHTFKVGFDGRKYISPQGFTQRARGDYEWNNLDGFLHDTAPDAFGERSTGNHTYYGDQTALYGYANDTFRFSDKLTFNAGLRYEFTSVPVGERSQALNSVASVPGLINFHAPQPSYTSFAPRFGVEYAPDMKTSIRAGYGIAYDVLFDNLGTLSFPPQYSSTQDVGSGSAPAVGSPNFLKNGGLPAGTGSGIAVLTPAQAKAATSAYLPDQVVPYSENYTLTIQRAITRGLTAEVGYVGTRGIHLPTQIQLDVQAPVTRANELFTTVGGNTLVPSGNGSNLAQLQAIGHFLPQFAANGFQSKITSYQPFSGSNYNGLVTNLQGHLHNLQLNLSYTWSKTMDNATDEVFATVLTPRRPEDSQNLNQDYSRSALDRTHRVSLEADYDVKAFRGRGWMLENLVGNWTIIPLYIYESPEYATALSGANSNLNGDSAAAIDRPLLNPNGVKGTGTGVTAVYNPNLYANCGTQAAPAVPGATCSGNLIGYTANNANAYYVEAGPGVLPTVGRNTMPIRPINNVDLSLFKKFNLHDRYGLELGAQAFNVLNHAQYQPGNLDNVNGPSYTDSYQFQTVSNAFFNRPDKEFLNNARTMQLSAKINF